MLYRFAIELSDVDRGVYETLSFQVPQHPSETLTYLLTRVLAFALCYREGLEFSPGGLADPEAPALKAAGAHGATDLWIEIGNPSAKKLHKAAKSSETVMIYTYKNPAVLVEEIRRNEVHRADEIKIYAVDADFLDALEKQVVKNNRWSLVVQDSHLSLDTGAKNFSSEIKNYPV